MNKFMVLSDIHIGWEKKVVRGRVRQEPVHSIPTITAVMDFARDFKPDWVLLNGDQLNCGPISHWLRGAPRLAPEFRLIHEMDLLDELILKPLDKLKPSRKVWKDGNHENWIHKFVNENPGVEGLVEPRNYLRLEPRGWELAGDEDVVRFGKIHYIHGHEIFRRGTPPVAGNGAKKLANAYRRNIRAGHLHTFEVCTDVTPADRSDYHTAILLPAMCKATPAYAVGSSSNYQMGFNWGYVDDDGTFSDYVSIINRGTFIANGKRYGR